MGIGARTVAWRCPVDMDGVWEIVRVDDWTRDPDPDCIEPKKRYCRS
jgi:hypothetical protein